MEKRDHFEFIEYQIVDSAALISFNRPEKFNAMNRAMKLEIIKAIKSANQDSTVRSLILTGHGKAFSSGQDLADRTVKADQGPVDLGNTLKTEWNPLVDAIKSSKKIVIGAINGVCAGAGLSVALACDLLVAKPQTKFVSGFVQIGLTPDAGSGHTLVRALGYRRTLEFFLKGNPLMAEDLLQVGLINHITENVLEYAQEWAQLLKGLPPLALEFTKQNLLYAQDHEIAQTMEREAFSQRFLGNTRDYQEGVQAFFEKRSPQFQGK